MTAVARFARETHAAAKAWLDAYTTRRAMLPAYLMVIAALTATLWSYDVLAQQRADDAVTVAARIAEQRSSNAEQVALELARIQCLNQADTDRRIRVILTAIMGELPQSDATASIIEIINRDPPAPSRDDCIEENQP